MKAPFHSDGQQDESNGLGNQGIQISTPPADNTSSESSKGYQDFVNEVEGMDLPNRSETARNTPTLEVNEPAPEHEPVPTELVEKAALMAQEGDATLFTAMYGKRYRYDHAEGQWYRWRTHHWEADQCGSVHSGLTEVARQYEPLLVGLAGQEALARVNEGGGVEALKGRRQVVAGKIRGLRTYRYQREVLALAGLEHHGMALRGNEWDRDGTILPVRNGLVELYLGELFAGRPEKYTRNFAPVEFLGLDAPCILWEKTVSEVFGGNKELVEFWQRLMGYCMTGLVREHVLPICWGAGRNGKGLLLETFGRVLGPMLAGPVKRELLLAQSYNKDAAAPDAALMRLRGMRLVWTSEMPEGRAFDQAKLKALTGGDSITARPPYGHADVTWAPTHKLLVMTNNRPRVRDAGDYATWSRVLLIPFTQMFVPDPDPNDPRQHPQDTDLGAKLMKEAPGILAWGVRGAVSYLMDGGLRPPAIVKAATEEYRQDEDYFTQFVQVGCEIGPDNQVQPGVFHTSLKAWMLDQGLQEREVPSLKSIGQRLRTQYERTVTAKGAVYHGIRVKQEYLLALPRGGDGLVDHEHYYRNPIDSLSRIGVSRKG